MKKYKINTAFAILKKYKGREKMMVNVLVANDLASSWINEEFYGFTQLVPQNVNSNYFKVLFIAANGDGTLSEKERNWILGFAAAQGFSQSIIDELQKCTGNDDLNDLLSTDSSLDPKYAGRALIRDAILAAGADGEYHDGERQTVLKLAKQLGVSEDVVSEIEKSVTQIKKLRLQEIELIFPEGKPY